MRDPADRFLEEDGDHPSPEPAWLQEMANLPVFVVVAQDDAVLGFPAPGPDRLPGILAFDNFAMASALALALEGKILSMRLADAAASAISKGASLCVMDVVNGIYWELKPDAPVTLSLRDQPITAEQQAIMQAITRPCGVG